VSPVKYELGFYIPEDDILHSHRCENLKSYKSIVVSITNYFKHFMVAIFVDTCSSMWEHF
jgi:hypothetical protein